MTNGSEVALREYVFGVTHTEAQPSRILRSSRNSDQNAPPSVLRAENLLRVIELRDSKYPWGVTRGILVSAHLDTFIS
jgi:hypothetical protein